MKVKIVIRYFILAAWFTLLVSLMGSCAFKRISRFKNIPYLQADTSLHLARQELNIFAPRKSSELKDVFVFIHGGSWNSGKKSSYNFLRSRMARKGVVAVIIDYPLSPKANYYQMASAAAKAVQWIKNNSRKYGGNPDKIFLSGHSAGGHLAALLTVRNEYFDTLGIVSPVKGCILIDAAGLDMYGYLTEEKFEEGHPYLQTFTSDPLIWKQASPLYHLHQEMPPLLIYRGERTYPSIIKSTEKFIAALKVFAPQPDYHILKGKRHIPMITQFLWSWNPLYGEIIEFMQQQR